MVEHWLNLWAAKRNLDVRFEVLNASRPATGPLDAAAILDYELDAVDIDYVIAYGFGNGIYLADALIKLPSGVVKGEPKSAHPVRITLVDRTSAWVSARLEPPARRSAAARFLRSRLLGQHGNLSSEPPKPAAAMEFPAGIVEASPNPDKIADYPGGGLMGLDTYLQGLKRIDEIAKRRDLRVFVSTFRIMAFDGMLLGPGSANIFKVLNEQYWWPYSYAQIRRLTAFYNRTLRAWAGRTSHDVIPVDEQMPLQPELYGDGMHELQNGEALHAWIVLQQLLPRIREDLANHRLPRPTICPAHRRPCR